MCARASALTCVYVIHNGRRFGLALSIGLVSQELVRTSYLSYHRLLEECFWCYSVLASNKSKITFCNPILTGVFVDLKTGFRFAINFEIF